MAYGKKCKAYIKEVTSEKKLASECTGKSRKEFFILVQFMTGHNFLKRHNNLVNGNLDTHPDSFCSFCDEEVPETTLHVFAQCDRFALIRREIFGDIILQPPFNFKLSNIMQFIRRVRIFSTYDDPTDGELTDGDTN